MKIKKILQWIDNYIEPTIMAVLLAVIVILIGINVVMRYIFSASLAWSDELARYCFIYLVFAGVGYAIKKESTIKINILETSVPKIASLLVTIQDLVYLLFLGYMIKPACSIVAYFGSHPQKSASLQMPMQYLYVSCAIGFGWAIFRMLQKYYRKLIHRRTEEEE